MKFKLDENFGTRTQYIFENAGHDVETVYQELLQGASDQHLYEVCCFLILAVDACWNEAIHPHYIK